MALVTLVYGLAGFHESSFDAYVLGVLGAAGIYSTSNVAQKFSKNPNT